MTIDHVPILAGGKIQRFMQEVETVAKSKGYAAAVFTVASRIRRAVTSRVRLYFWYYYNRVFMSGATFLFQGRQYHYFIHKYNVTWRNERVVEVPIVKRILEETNGDVLEVGNVISHYFDRKHDVVDKYERAEGVLTEDVTEIQTLKRYDLIISISTLEHVGWDENPTHKELMNAPNKVLVALEKLKTLLKPKGKIIVTVPLGYNPHLDKLLESGRLLFDKRYFMKRVPEKNAWIEAGWEDVKDSTFNNNVPTANAIMIGIVENQA